ncbi:MAG: phosphoribosylanthranilate isomerase [Oscillospiraceae bacterium]|nr:phosphoribosylanthranilate isomerase [Oscillospiraceae bacterium]
MTKIKLCGMMAPEDVTAACELGADMVGFILTDGFRRSVSHEAFTRMRSILDGHTAKAVGVFVDEPIEAVLRYADMLDMIQLHGSEDDNYIKAVGAASGKPVIKAFKVKSTEDIADARKSAADFVLLDSGTGTGMTFDHTLIEGIDRTFFLAGGLTADNVAGAIEKIRPYAVDVSSSLETGGHKDRSKMTEFVRAVRGKER